MSIANATSTATVVAAAESTAAAATDAHVNPPRFWDRKAQCGIVRVSDTEWLPELAATHVKWKRMCGKVVQQVEEHKETCMLRKVIENCKERGYIGVSIFNSCSTVYDQRHVG